MPRNEDHVYDEEGNDLLARTRRPRRPLGTLFGGLGVLAALAGGAWAFHHYNPQQFGKVFSLPGQNPVLKSQSQAWPTVTPAHNAMLNALSVKILQMRPLPKPYADLRPVNPGHPLTMASGNLEVRITNNSSVAMRIGAVLYVSTACAPLLEADDGVSPFTPTFLPPQDSIWSVDHLTSGGSSNSTNLFLALAPRQTKTGWMGVFYFPNCHAHPSLLVFSDATLQRYGGVTRVFRFPPLGAPVNVPSAGS